MDLVCPFDRFIFVADDASSRTSDERRAIRIGPSDGACFDPRRRGRVFCVIALRATVRSSDCFGVYEYPIGTQYVGELGGPTRPYGEAYIVYLGEVERFAVGSTVGAGSGPGSYGAAR